jgi:hypothetical protein
MNLAYPLKNSEKAIARNHNLIKQAIETFMGMIYRKIIDIKKTMLTMPR